MARSESTPIATYIEDFRIAAESGRHMRRSRPLSEYTIAGYLKALTQIDRELGHPTLADFTLDSVERLITTTRKRSKSNARLLAAVAKTFSHWLERAGHTSEHRLEELGVPLFNARRSALSDQDFRAVLRAINVLSNRTRNRVRATVLLMAGTGIRSNEARTLSIGDVHIEKPLSQSWVFIRWDHTKSNRQRQVRLAEDAAAAIHLYVARDRIETKDHATPLFLRENGTRFTYEGWQKMWGRIADELEHQGIPDVTAHIFRHQWATMAARAGATQAELEQEGGWERGSKVPAQYIDKIPFDEMQTRPSPLTAFLQRKPKFAAAG